MSVRGWLRRARIRAVGADLAGLDARSGEQAQKLDRLLAARDEDERSLAALADRMVALDAEVRQQRTAWAPLAAVEARLADIEHRIRALEGLAVSARDDIPRLRRELAVARDEADYERAFADAEPLVSVRIASYVNTAALMDVALASVLAQSYQRLEIVIVNDGPNDATRRSVEALRDPRIRYVEFPARRSYPDDARQRWMVAGAPGMNEGARLATGDWIAPLDDDDAFTSDHVEVLLGLARETRAEVAYGAAIQVDAITGERVRIHASPPERGGFTFQAALLHRALRVFEYDEESWRVDEPGDWNLCRRMLAAGVRFAARDVEVAVVNRVPYVAKEDGES